MQTQPLSSTQEASPRPSPVDIWQQLLSYLLDRHYGLTLNDTPLGHDGVIQEHIDAGISLCDAVNFIVEKYDLVRTDRPGFSAETQLPLLNSIDILRARKACGLMTRNDYRTVTDITTGKYCGVQP
ncbi:toxin CbtA [Klebsiella pneumoniae]|uniref:TA system toxin CbtA family protein n=1 Tax=Klebsiella pneumoniae complex TaxID=3390273 RepID=UPI000A191FF7|nr:MULTISPECIES: TA system toxin CbtA family protein [Klebsiella]MCS6039602.1 toxin [Klebsiella pneumoniae subsp. pneumoniae]BBV78446.1 cytoskeleton-binding toxin CbtA [Raoultella planticola]HCQ8126930.1 toxin CbtA [Klebsiella quasipneumoniae subsp. similipneumoniae]EKZ5323968.1 toxin CbtA [Klebsiella quasipneumoniae]EKZ5468001.1 toxin CbtA [Klebsiella quasipneumoniae]